MIDGLYKVLLLEFYGSIDGFLGAENIYIIKHKASFFGADCWYGCHHTHNECDTCVSWVG